MNEDRVNAAFNRAERQLLEVLQLWSNLDKDDYKTLCYCVDEIMMSSNGPDEDGEFLVEIPGKWRSDGNAMPVRIGGWDDRELHEDEIDHHFDFMLGKD